MQSFVVSTIQRGLYHFTWPLFLSSTLYSIIKTFVHPEPPIVSEHVLITGATSGIGKALAIKYLSTAKTMVLVGRNSAKMEELKKELTNVMKKTSCFSCTVYYEVADVTDKSRMKSILNRYKNIDLVIANAGIVQDINHIDFSGNVLEQTTEQLFNTNVHGVFNTVLPAIENMKKNQHGQICVISSVCGLGSDGLTPIYNATKCAISAWAEGLRPVLEPYNIHVSIACPGPVNTPMLKLLHIPMSFSITPAECAQRIYQGLQKDEFHIICSSLFYCLYGFLVHDVNFAIKNLIFKLESYIRRFTKSTPIPKEIAFAEETPYGQYMTSSSGTNHPVIPNISIKGTLYF